MAMAETKYVWMDKRNQYDDLVTHQEKWTRECISIYTYMLNKLSAH